MREVAELRWRFTTVESDLGIRSTFGAQLDNAYAQMPSDDEVRRAKRIKALRTRISRGWKPTDQRTLDALEELMGIGTPGALYKGDGNYSVNRLPGSDHMFDENHIHLHAPVRTPPADPYESDAVLFLVRRLRDIDRRRRLIGRSHDRVLEAVYGNSTAGDDVLVFRKRFGDLVDVVIAIVNSQRGSSDPPARAIIRAKLTDDSFVRMMRHGASGYLRAACDAYAETRS